MLAVRLVVGREVGEAPHGGKSACNEVPATCCDTARDNELAARIERVRRDIAGELLVRASFKLRIRSVVVDSSVMMGK